MRRELLFAALLGPLAAAPGAPSAEKKPVIDDEAGVRVRDDYR